MDVLGPRIFHDRPVLSSRRRLPGRFQFAKLVLYKSRTNLVSLIEELLPWKPRPWDHWSVSECYLIRQLFANFGG